MTFNIKILLINFSIISILLFSIFIAKANDEINIQANEITVDETSKIIGAKGDVKISNNEIRINSDSAQYFKEIDIIKAKDNIKINDNYNNNYYADTLNSNEDFSIAEAENIKIRLKDNARVVGNKFIKKNELNIVTNGQYTPCREDGYLVEDCPGWKLKAKTVYHDEKSKTMHYDHSILYILNFPVLYSPYFSHPDPSINKRSGFLAPMFQADDKLGQIVSIPYFYNIAGNKDFTFIPTLQTTSNNYITSEFRLLNKSGTYKITGNINDNSDELGSKHFVFANAEINSPLNKFSIDIQTANNDTYMKKNQINEIDVLKSGLLISDQYKGNDFLLETRMYKHLSTNELNQWEYLYPKVNYNIANIKIPSLKGNLGIKNEIVRLRSLNKNISTSISSEFNYKEDKIDMKRGLVYENFIDTRLTYHSVKYADTNNDTRQIRMFPQIGSKISFPLKKNTKNFSQILKPVVMPLLAPYNNYTSAQEINNSNIFSRNRASGLYIWESGPRINYGTEWFIEYKNKYDGSITIGQSMKFNKKKNDHSDEISDVMASLFLNFGQNLYTNAEFVIDRKEYNVNKSNVTSLIDLNKIKIKAEYDYVSSKFASQSEQLGLAARINIDKNLDFIFSGKRDLDSKTNIGYESGLFYENDCLAVNFKYYRDLTKFKDIEEAKGISFLITLKPFGSSKSYGKSKTFGPQI